MPAQAPSPTASAVVGDILSLSEQISRGVAPLPEIEPYGHNLAFKPMDELQTKYYVRLKVADRVGALSETVDIFAKHNISISLINRVEDGKSGVSDACSVIFLTHRALEKDVRAAAAEACQRRLRCRGRQRPAYRGRRGSDRRRHGQLAQHPLINTHLGGSRPMWDGSPFYPASKHSGKAAFARAVHR